MFNKNNLLDYKIAHFDHVQSGRASHKMDMIGGLEGRMFVGI